ncbi:sigma-70 family RNA polymerase sigma factor [Mesorhizobium sp. M0276]|uniref:sigma-70 family RNA polymerase sigma factor n=1 Tax=Mesorhizobium sp. M0276 TaxID=2956928 RepID=UPI003338EFA2
MSQDPRSRVPPLRLVANDEIREQDASREARDVERAKPAIPDVDWTILMARAQDGDGDAYLRLLEGMTPYLRSLARRRCHDQNDIEDIVQDVLLTVHSIRHTYDPTRPFGPWLVAIANRRIVDRLRRQGRVKARETPLAPQHETFPEAATNIEEMVDLHCLKDAIENLPPKQNQAIRLLKLKEMSLKEAAVASGMSIVSLKIATHRALKSLRKVLTDRSDT